MSDATLTNAQALKLLLELATNPGFRQRFEEKPAAALVEFGIPHETVVNLNAACLAPATLVDSKALQKAHDEFKEKGVNACLSMISPHLKVGTTA
ncbi:MAG: NHLP-related RiPP peptide [Dokdonella sp.]